MDCTPVDLLPRKIQLFFQIKLFHISFDYREKKIVCSWKISSGFYVEIKSFSFLIKQLRSFKSLTNRVDYYISNWFPMLMIHISICFSQILNVAPKLFCKKLDCDACTLLKILRWNVNIVFFSYYDKKMIFFSKWMNVW